MNTDCNWCYIYRGNKAEKCEECGKRLKRGEGSGALTGFAAAKRAAEPGGAEDRERSDCPQSLAVSPVEDLASFERCQRALSQKVAELREQQIIAREMKAVMSMDDAIEASATIIEGIIEFLSAVAPKPESESSETQK